MKALSVLSLAVLLSIYIAACDGAGVTPADVSTSSEDVAAKNRNSPKVDLDNNGIPDAGVFVNGHYTSLYAYDAIGGWFVDYGDGRIAGTVASVDDLDQATLDVCKYVNNYRADFGNTPYMDAGWIQNHITCKGYSGTWRYNYLIVHQTDPRYTGNPDFAVWGTWEYHVLTESHSGNLVAHFSNPQRHIGG